MENLDCTKDTILIIDHGENRGSLRTAVVDYPEAKYLKTSESCPTMYERVDEPRPSWVAYLGPFDIREGCRLRMGGEHRSDSLTRLQRGNESLVKCLCELSLTEDDFPVLTPGMQPTERDRVWINQLQGSLLDLGRLPAESGWPNSTYDQATINQVNAMLERSVAGAGRRHRRHSLGHRPRAGLRRVRLLTSDAGPVAQTSH